MLLCSHISSPCLQLQCFCQNAAQALPRCRRPDSGDLQFPVACPEGDVLMPLPDFAAGGEAQGMPLHVEPLSAAQGIASVSGLLGCDGRQGVRLSSAAFSAHAAVFGRHC